MTEKEHGLTGHQPVSAKHLLLIKWIPNGDTDTKKLRISEAMAPLWRKIAVLIGLSQPQIVSIENPGSGSTPDICLDEVLEKWQQVDSDEERDYPYTWDGVKDVLQDIELKELARKLEDALSSGLNTVRGNLRQRSGRETLATKDETKNILKPHYLDIYMLLDFDKLYPLLCREGFLRTKDQSEITKYKLTMEGKISKLLDVIESRDAQREFIDLVGQIARQDTKQKELHDILRNRTTSKKEKHNSTSWTYFIAAAFVFVMILTLFLKYPGYFNFFDRYQSKSLIHPSKIFVGREQEKSELMTLLDFRSGSTDIRIVNIVGSPGFGKSTLAIHVGHQMVQQGIVVHYVDMAEYQVHDSSVQEILAENILKAAEYTLETYAFEKLRRKLRTIFWNTLIIIDDCDDLVRNNNKTRFFNALELMVKQTTRLRILITSREVTIHLEYFKRYPLYELSKRASCELIERILPPNINHTINEIEQVANLTGNAPLALQIIGALLNSPNPPSMSQIIDELNDRPIPFLSGNALQHNHKINVSISLSYRYLSPNMQKISQYLANFPGSFTLDTAKEVLNCTQACPCLENSSKHESSVTDTLDNLLSRSLIEFNPFQQRYTFHRLIREFLRDEQIPQDKDEFNSNFHVYYSSLLVQTIDLYDNSVNYKLALLTLGTERQNFQKILEDIKTKNHQTEPFLKMILNLAITKPLPNTIHFLRFSFGEEEIMMSLYSALEYIEENQVLHQQTNSFKLAYLSILYEVIKIRKNLFGNDDAFLVFSKKENIVNSVIACDSMLKTDKIKVYKQLEILYKELDNYEKMEECEKAIFSLEKDLGFICNETDPKSECSYIEMSLFYYDNNDYEKAARYFELVYKLEFFSLDEMFKFSLLAKMAEVNNRLDRKTEVKKYSQIMQTMLNDDLISPTEMYKEKKKLTGIIKNLLNINLHAIAEDLNHKLLEVTLEIESYETTCFERNDDETLSLIKHCYARKNYDKTIQLGRQFLKNIKACHNSNRMSFIISQGEMLVAKAIYWGESKSKGMDKMEDSISPFLQDQFLQQVHVGEFSDICLYLIPRLKYIPTCYPEVYNIPHYTAIGIMYTVFAIPIHSSPSDHVSPSPPPTSTVPEIIISRSKTVSTRTESALAIAVAAVDYVQTIVPSATNAFIGNAKWLWSLFYDVYSQYSIIRFVVNILSVCIRLEIFLFILFRMQTFLFIIIVEITVNVCIILVFRFPKVLLFPSTIDVLNFMIWIFEFLVSCDVHIVCIYIPFHGLIVRAIVFFYNHACYFYNTHFIL